MCLLARSVHEMTRVPPDGSCLQAAIENQLDDALDMFLQMRPEPRDKALGMRLARCALLVARSFSALRMVMTHWQGHLDESAFDELDRLIGQHYGRSEGFGLLCDNLVSLCRQVHRSTRRNLPLPRPTHPRRMLFQQ